ncbi:MAG: tetratricopeptide repeat protein [Bdellovibrionota bacterium]|nr:MAG: tetratricopeptide repeat protein [Bdellovibrionota bacterium]
MNRYFLPTILYVAALSGCSAVSSPGPSAEFDVAVDDSRTRKFDPQLSHRSEVYHHYLLSQLAYDQEEIEDASSHLEKVRSLLEEPVPDVLVQLSQLQLRLGEVEQARATIAPLISREPPNTDHLLLYAGILEALGETGNAAEIYKSLLQGEANRIEPYLLAAEIELQQGGFDEAVRILQMASKHFPKEALVHSTLGQAYERHQRFVEANRAYQTAFDLERSTPHALDLVRILLKKGATAEAITLGGELAAAEPSTVFLRRFVENFLSSPGTAQEALRELERYEEAQEENLPLRMRLALYLLQHQSVEGAMRELVLVLAKSPDHAQARYQLATLLASRGRSRESVEELFKIEADDEMFIKSRTFAAFVARQSGDFESAERAIRDARKKESSNPQLLAYLVLLLRDSKKFAEARELLEEALAEDPQNDRLLFNYALVLHDLGDTKGALVAMEKVIEINPSNSDALNFVSYTLVEQGNPDHYPRALALVEKALAIRPDDGYYLDTLGWVLFHLSRYEEAEKVLSRAVQATGDDLVILEHYGEVLLKLNRLGQARDLFQRALEREVDLDDREQREARQRIEEKLQRLQN